MKLDAARLCLDCEEVHDEQICPACSSEAFAFLTRWVQPAIEHEPVADARPRLPEPPAASAERPAPARTPEQVDAYRQLLAGAPAPRRKAGLLTGGVLGVAAVTLAGWWLRSSGRPDADAATPVGDDSSNP